MEQVEAEVDLEADTSRLNENIKLIVLQFNALLKIALQIN